MIKNSVNLVTEKLLARTLVNSLIGSQKLDLRILPTLHNFTYMEVKNSVKVNCDLPKTG